MMHNPSSSQSLGIKARRHRFSNISRQDEYDELVSGDDNLTLESSTTELTSHRATKNSELTSPMTTNHFDSQRTETRRSSYRFQDALNEYASYRHSMSGRVEDSGTKRTLGGGTGGGRLHSVSLITRRDVGVHTDLEETMIGDETKPRIRILKAYSSLPTGRQTEEQVIGNCCKNLDSLRLVNKESVDDTVVDSNSAQFGVTGVVDDVTGGLSSRADDDSRVGGVSSRTGKKQKRRVKKMFHISKGLRRGITRKGTSTKGVRFEILRECPVEGEVDNLQVEGQGQGKSKKKRKAAKRIAKTAGKRLWKGFRVGCKFLWEGLIIYAKPFGTMDFTSNITRAWDEKNNTYNNNNNNNNNNKNNNKHHTYHNYSTSEGVNEPVL